MGVFRQLAIDVAMVSPFKEAVFSKLIFLNENFNVCGQNCLFCMASDSILVHFMAF